MSVSYIFEDHFIDSFPHYPDQTYAYVGLKMDLTLLANATGVTDSSRFSGTWDWSEVTGYKIAADQLFTYSCLIRLTADTAVLTVGGDYHNASDASKKHNLYLLSKNSPYRVSAARAEGDLRLVLVAQTGAYGASGNLDENISVYAESAVTRTKTKVYETNAPITNDTSAIGYDVAGILVVSSDLLGKVTTVTNSTLPGLRLVEGDKTKPVNTSVDQRADAVAVRSASLTLIRNFNAELTVTSTLVTAGYASLTVTGNSAAAVGIRVYGDLSAENGEWNGVIKATAKNSDGRAMKADLDGEITSFSPASVNNNDFSAYGIWADGTIDIAHIRGKESGADITAVSTGHKLTAEASADSGASITMTGNSLSAFGIKGKTVNLDRVDATFSISTDTKGHAVTATTGGGKPSLTINNLIASVGIEAETLNLGSFNGQVTVSAGDVTVKYNTGEQYVSDNDWFKVSGFYATNINAGDNLGGTITVTAKNLKLNGAGDGAKLEVFGIYAADTLKVTGRIDTDITINGSGNNVKAETTNAIHAEYILADAFSGTLTSQIDIINNIGIQGNTLISTARSLTADAFDINGTITGFKCGIVSLGKLNLRVSGTISAKTVIAAERYYTIKAGELFEIINPSTGLADKVEFSKTAVITGDIELGRGENSVVINSGASINGTLLATDGLMNIRFDLDETVQQNAAIVNTTLKDVSLASTTTISVNLNNAENDGEYTLFSYSGNASQYWKGNKQITFSYQGRSEVVNVDGNGKASVEFKDGKGQTIVRADLQYHEDTKKVTVKVVNNGKLADFGGTCTTTLDTTAHTALLSWNNAVSAENYEVEYSIDNGKTIVVMVAGSRKSVTINGIDSGSTISWRVRGNTGDGSEVSAWSDWSGDGYGDDSYARPQMAAATPRAVNPDEAGGGVTASRARFTWEAATGSIEIAGYEAQFITSKSKLTEQQIKDIYADPQSIAGDSDKKFFTKYTTATEVVVTSLTNQSYVYWRVRAVDVSDNPNNKSDFKDGESFRIWVGDNVKPVWRKLDDNETDAATASVTYNRSDAYNVKLSVKFSWISAEDTQSGVKSYLLQYKRNGDSWLDETKVNSVTVTDNGSKTYSAELKNLEGDLYDYRIKAVDFVGNESTYLVTSQFGASDLTPPSGKFTSFSTPVVTGTWETVETTDEMGNKTEETVLTGVTVKLGWNDDFKDDSAIIYKVEVADNGDFLGKRVYSFETTEKSLTLDDSVGTASSVLAGMSKVYYRVSVKDAKGNVNPIYSQVQNFNMADSSTGEAIRFSPVAAAPTGLSVSKSKVVVGSSYRTNLTFRWADGDNKFGVYDYTLSLTSGGTTKNYTVSGNSITIAKQLDGNYTWKVTANTGSGSSASATGTKFTVDATAPTFAAGASSSVSVVGRDFVINWSAATDKNGIAGYVLQYGAGTNTALWQTVTIAKDSSGKVATSYKGSISSSGDYNYRIYAVDAYGNNSSEAQSYIGKSFSIVSETHTTRNTARTITVTDVRDRNNVAAVSANVGLSVGSDWSKFVIAQGGTDAYITIGGVSSRYNSGSGVTVKVYAANSTKALSTISVASGDKKLQLRFSNKGTYYLEVTPKKSTSIMEFSVSVASDTPTAAQRASDDNAWNSTDKAAGVKISSKNYNGKYRFAIAPDDAAGKVAKKKLLSDYVGVGDSVDYRRFDIKTAGSYTFSLDGVATNLVFTIYSTKLDSNGNVASVKSVKKLTLAPKYDSKNKKWVATVSTGSMLLNKGTYYFSVTAPDAKNSKNSVYDAFVSGTAFVKGNTKDDNWQKLSADYQKTVPGDKGKADVALCVNEWAGYGDTVDYRKVTIKKAGRYNFTLTGLSNTATLTVYSVNAKNKLVKIKSVTNAKSGAIKNLLMSAGTYYVEVKANNAASGKNTDYEAKLTGNVFTAGNNKDDNWQKLSADYQKTVPGDKGKADVALCVKEWAGYSDAVDYRKLTIKKAGRYDFSLTGLINTATLTVYSVNAKNKLVKIKSVTNAKSGAIKVLLMEAGTYYVEVKANNAASGKNTNYEVKLAGTVFTAGNNKDDNWKVSGLPTLDTKSPLKDWVGFGDKIDYRALTVASKGGFYNFKLSEVGNNVKITVYMKSGDKLKQVKTVTAKAKSTVSTGDLLLKSGTKYYLAVEAPGAAKAQNSNYTVNMTGKTFNHFGNETWKSATLLNANVGDGLLTTAAGGDKIDYFDLSKVAAQLKLDAGQGKLKVSFYDKNNKSVKVAQVKMANGSVKKNVASLTLVTNDKVADNITLGSLSDSIRYMKIEAATNSVNTYKLSLLA